MKWYYFYTKDYEYWNKHLKSRLENDFEIYPIQINELNLTEKIGKHHFDGVTQKIELVVEAIKKNIGTKIIFSDCTLFINKNNLIKLKNYLNDIANKDFDLVFADNNDNTVNICLIIINCNEHTLKFFNDVINIIKNGKITWDQEAVNKLLDIHKNIKYSKFDNKLIVCDYNLVNKKGFYIYKQFIYPINKTLNWNYRITYLYKNNLIDYNEYKNNILEYDILKNKITDYIIYTFWLNLELIIFIIILVILVTIIYNKYKK